MQKEQAHQFTYVIIYKKFIWKTRFCLVSCFKTERVEAPKHLVLCGHIHRYTAAHLWDPPPVSTPPWRTCLTLHHLCCCVLQREACCHSDRDQKHRWHVTLWWVPWFRYPHTNKYVQFLSSLVHISVSWHHVCPFSIQILRFPTTQRLNWRTRTGSSSTTPTNASKASLLEERYPRTWSRRKDEHLGF